MIKKITLTRRALLGAAAPSLIASSGLLATGGIAVVSSPLAVRSPARAEALEAIAQVFLSDETLHRWHFVARSGAADDLTYLDHCQFEVRDV